MRRIIVVLEEFRFSPNRLLWSLLGFLLGAYCIISYWREEVAQDYSVGPSRGFFFSLGLVLTLIVVDSIFTTIRRLRAPGPLS